MKHQMFKSEYISDRAIERLKAMLDESRNVVITCHTAPDGDAVGSSLGLMHVLRNAGKEVTVIVPDAVSVQLHFLPGVKSIVNYSWHGRRGDDLLARADLLMSLDYNDLKRVDKLEPALASAQAHKVLIDHHLFPSDFADVTISHPEVSSTCALLYRVIERLGMTRYIDADAAECLYTGMMTDTGNFSYNSNDPDLYLIVSDLVSRGVDKDRVYTLAMNSKPEDSIRLNAYALANKMKVFKKHRAALITLTRDELNRYRYQKGYTEGLVNQPLAIPEVVYSVYLRDEDTFVKVSCRSKGDFPVNKMCEEYFGGGGHLNAAGGEFPGTMDECISRLDEAMEAFDKYLSKE